MIPGQPCPIALDHRQVGWGQIKAGEVVHRGPHEFRMLGDSRLGALRGQADDERDHFNHHGAIVVKERGQRSHDHNQAAELLLNLAKNGGFRQFAWLDLAAGEFPFESKVLVGRASGDQHAVFAFDHSADDGDGWRHEERLAPARRFKMAKATPSVRMRWET